MELGQFPAQRDPPLRSEGRQQVIQGGAQLMGRLVEDHGALLPAKALEVRRTVLLVHRQKALEGEPAGGQTADRQRRHQRAGAGNGAHLHPRLSALRHQLFAGVADGRCARVRHQSAVFSRQNAAQDLRAAALGVMPVIAHHGLFDTQMVQDLQRHTGILGGDKIRLPQGLDDAFTQIPQISDGGGHQI